MQSKHQYFVGRALQAVTAGAILGYFTNNLWLGLGFAIIVFGLFWFNSRNKSFSFSPTASEQANPPQNYQQATVWALAVTLLVYLMLIIVSQRYLLPFQPGGFALISGIFAGVLVLYLQRRKTRK